MLDLSQDYEEYDDVRSLKLHIDEHLSKRPLANSTYHTQALPKNVCDEIVRRYSARGWEVSYSVRNATVFSFLRRSG